MCVYIDTIKDVLDELIEDEERFSAHDVTKRVRKIEGGGVNVRHSEVRDLVHAMMTQEDGYTDEFNGTWIEYVPVVPDPANDPATIMAPSAPQAAPPSPPPFADSTVELYDGEKLTIEFRSPVTRVTISQG
jgi:hypothetical protein